MASRSGALELEETIAFPDWVMLDRMGHTSCHDDHAAAHDSVNNDDTAASVQTSSGHSCYFSCALAAPPRVSYISLHWPELPAVKFRFPNLPARPYVLAADDNLVLIRVAIASQDRFYGVPSDLFVYAVGPASSSPPRYASLCPLSCLPRTRPMDERSWLLAPSSASYSSRQRRQETKTAATLSPNSTSPPRKIGSAPAAPTEDINNSSSSNNNSGNNTTFARLCVFSSKTGNWRIITKRAPPQNNGCQFLAFWSTNVVFPFDGRFLCWVDYFKGLLLSDFSKISSPALHFVPFPGKQYAYDNIRESTRSCPGKFRSVSVSQGMIRFVHIDNEFHEKDKWNRCRDCSERKRQKLGTKITVWTLKNVMDIGGSSRFEWEVHRVINLECLWAQVGYQDQGLPRRVPEFPVIVPDDPDVLCCVLREEEYRGKEWMIMVDMKYAYLRSCTPCVDEKPNSINCFRSEPLLPSVFLKYLERPAGN